MLEIITTIFIILCVFFVLWIAHIHGIIFSHDASGLEALPKESKQLKNDDIFF